ncbi:hypothetical protein BG842_12315 [Haladaptatus sp. W1]|uniref:DUF7504 family protein n=1 Tax=Haladaptatus sp. W1 TaxID=1897478 RepID=UPI00084994B2|nr:HalOD1 output domain-containing protein [Haladaptatus sp. W1]ODR79501.1 hypothetical protein BG842_12315 [Haladaptatus sp. W1]
MTTAGDSSFGVGSGLLFTAAMGRGDDSDCVRQLSVGDGGDRNVLIVTYNRAPEVVYNHWESRIGNEPTEFGVVAVGGGGARTGTHRLQPGDDDNDVSLANPASLGRLETTIHLYLDEWAANDYPTILCFDSISAVLRHVDRTTAFRFLHSLTEFLRQRDIVAHFHLDPDQHDETTIAMLRSLFDVAGECHESGFEKPVPAEILSSLLGAPRRRLVCRYLSEVVDSAPISAIAEQVAAWERSGTPSKNEIERVHITLHHVHLPALAAVGVLERDGETVSARVEEETLKQYVRLTADDAATGTTPVFPGQEPVRIDDRAMDEASEVYWTVYGTAPDSVVVTLARALGDVSDSHATELRPVLAEVIDIDALQRLAEHTDISVYATFEYEGYEVVVDSGEIKLYDSR